jgi:hypothetical protein
MPTFLHLPFHVALLGAGILALAPVAAGADSAPLRRTTISIVGDQFFINGRPT